MSIKPNAVLGWGFEVDEWWDRFNSMTEQIEEAGLYHMSTGYLCDGPDTLFLLPCPPLEMEWEESYKGLGAAPEHPDLSEVKKMLTFLEEKGQENVGPLRLYFGWQMG